MWSCHFLNRTSFKKACCAVDGNGSRDTRHAEIERYRSISRRHLIMSAMITNSLTTRYTQWVWPCCALKNMAAKPFRSLSSPMRLPASPTPDELGPRPICGFGKIWAARLSCYPPGLFHETLSSRQGKPLLVAQGVGFDRLSLAIRKASRALASASYRNSWAQSWAALQRS